MSLELTLILLLLPLGCIGLALWTERHPPAPGRLRPPIALLLALGVVGGILLGTHLLALLTGIDLKGQARF